MLKKSLTLAALLTILSLSHPLLAAPPATTDITATTTTPPALQSDQKPVKTVPSDDPLVQNFHPLGLVNNTTNLFRSGDPIREIDKTTGKPLEDPATIALADKIMQHLHDDRNIRTLIDLERPSTKDNAPEKGESLARLNLEKAAAERAGITFINLPMKNTGKNSLQDMTDAQTLTWLQSVDSALFQAAQNGAVEFHCAGGRDRTGIVAAYLRLKYNHWTPDQAIQEMRNDGHNWTNFSTDKALTTPSWHESHLRAIAQLLQSPSPTTAPKP